jgi:hypothetical protein
MKKSFMHVAPQAAHFAGARHLDPEHRVGSKKAVVRSVMPFGISGSV